MGVASICRVVETVLCVWVVSVPGTFVCGGILLVL